MKAPTQHDPETHASEDQTPSAPTPVAPTPETHAPKTHAALAQAAVAHAPRIEARHTRLIEVWIEKAKAARVLTASREGAETMFGGWFERLGEAADGDESAAAELYKMAALHALALGSQGKPTSITVMQVLLLEDALSEEGLASPETRALVRELLRVVADAQTVGHAERLNARHLKMIRDASPVVRVGPDLVVGFLIGPMDRDNIDALFGRVMREGVGTGARCIVIDVRGAEPNHEILHDTLVGYAQSDVATRLSLVITGLPDIASILEPIETLNNTAGRRIITLETQDLAAFLDAWLVCKEP
ncbi:MAG: hypothetical protein H6729_05550 [Deltaproteobacteria bacterium]|nr:hypothetical protein [Deltaproteobacteria bacterium]